VTPDLPDLTYQAGVFDPITFLSAISALGLSAAGMAGNACRSRACLRGE